MFELRERDELPQPCQGTTEDGHQFFACEIAERQLKGNKQKFVARTHRERSAQRDALKVPRHRSYTPFKICRDRRVVCPEKKVGHLRAGPAGRARAASGHLVSAGCGRARYLPIDTGREPVAAHTSERSPGARESGKKRTKVTRHAPRRIPRSSAPRPATRSSRASSRRTRRTRGPICMISPPK